MKCNSIKIYTLILLLISFNLVFFSSCILHKEKDSDNLFFNGNGLSSFGDWIYYNEDHKFYRIKNDKTQNSLVYNDVISNFYIYKNWIYFFPQKESTTLYKMRLDGTDKTEICNISNFGRLVNIYNDYIYFTDFDYNRLLKLKIDNTHELYLFKDLPIFNIAVIEDDIFCEVTDNNENLFIIKGDGNKYTKIADGTIINIYNNMLYLINQNGQICSSNLDGTKIEIIGGKDVIRALMNKNEAFYISKENKIKKINLTTKEEIKISDDNICEILLVDDWVYYRTSYENQTVYRIKADGSHKEVFLD